MTALTTKLDRGPKGRDGCGVGQGRDGDAVRAKLEAVAKIQTDIAMLHYSKAVKPIAASVTDDQKTQIDAMRRARHTSNCSAAASAAAAVAVAAVAVAAVAAVAVAAPAN